MPPTEAEEAANVPTSTTTNVLGNFASIEDFTKAGFADIIKATKAVNAFPQGASRDMYCSYPSYGRVIDQQSNRILGIISKVLKWQNVKGNIQRRQPDEQFEMLLECNDAILERVGSNLDELAGVKKNPQTIVVESQFNTDVGKGAGSWNLKRADAGNANVASAITTKMTTARLITAKNIARPQINFTVPVDNSSLSPFVPRLKEKPNSLKPLAVLPEYDDDGVVASYLHPYEFELMKFDVPANQLQTISPKKPKDINATAMIYVDTLPKLKSALEELRAHNCIAIDVEHHSYRSFLGLTCLVQISSVDKDYILDALELREEMHILNAIFTDPKVVKIFHGADSDIEWLQRDLSLYIVNMFDTHQAAKSLNFARLSLAYVLKHYCNLELDKSFQLADWRMRPLPRELLEYARSDTHYLIYVYQCMTNDLLAAGNGNSNVLSVVYERCTELCRKRYQKPVIRATTHLEICRKAKRVFDNRQMFALEQILQWRDTIARNEDESYGYVLPNHMMLQIAESLPREMQGILACCNPIPPLVRQHLHNLHQIILRAREQPLVKPILETSDNMRETFTQNEGLNDKLQCTLDTTYDEDFRDDLPTLFSFKDDKIITQTVDVKETPWLCEAKLKIFKKNKLQNDQQQQRQQKKAGETYKLSLPYQRFLAYIPFAEQEKLEEAARLEAQAKKRRLCPAAAPEMMQFTAGNTTTSTSVKQEKKGNDDEDLYALPIKQMLKRKYEEAQAKKLSAADNTMDNNTTPPAKRFKANNKKNNNKAVVDNQMTKQIDLTADDDDADDDDMPVELPIAKEDNDSKQKGNATRQEKRKFKNKNRFKRQKTQQSSSEHITASSSSGTMATSTTTINNAANSHKKNFDYKNVDFKRFSGGAKRAQGTELKPQIHGKNNSSNKAKNKKFNKLFTFSNVKGNKK